MGRRFRDGPVRFAVLVPHRDCRRLLRLRSAILFSSGFLGAWSFPHVAPLALLSAPLGEGELRELARNLRRRSQEEGGGGMLRPGPPAVLPLAPPLVPFSLCLYGPALELRLTTGDFGSGAGKLRALLPPLLGCAVLGEGPGAGKDGTGNPEGLKFRAAAVANMAYRPLAPGDRAYSFSWRIGGLRWLPSGRRQGGSGPPDGEGR
jgi:hypothetical protein